MGHRCAVLLAAGEGKRMNWDRSKVLCQVLFRPMIGWVTSNCIGAGINHICVVVGKDSEDVCKELPENAVTVVQDRRLGTGHAVGCARGFLQENIDSDVLIANGDAPFLFPEFIEKAYRTHLAEGCAMTVLSAHVREPFGYGRIVRDGSGVSAIVEQRDANDAEEQITEINSGAYWFRARDLLEVLDRLTPANDQGELYITDALELLRKAGKKVAACDVEDSRVVKGANTRRQLAELNSIAREMVFDRLYDGGVDIPITDGVMIDPRAVIGPGTRILPGTIIRGATTVGREAVIGPNSCLEDATVGDGCILDATYVASSVLEEDVHIGPFSRVRPGCHIAKGVRVGNFVEIKNSNVGPGTKSAHLTYIGDSDVGAGVNFGCGVCIANYDGKHKYRTVVGDNCFIGCNTNLVAPVKVGDGAYTAAGTTVTVDVPPDALCIGRAREVIKEGRALLYRKGAPEK